MAYGRYSGAWSRVAHVNQPVRLVEPINPEHSDPTANLGPVDWVDTTRAPGLPGDSLGGEYVQQSVPGAVVDQTPDGYGVGLGHGLTERQASATRLALHEQDFGAAAARVRQPFAARSGGPETTWVDNTPRDGDSPDTLQYKRTGWGSPNDPGARLSKRMRRFWDEWIDWHRWGVEQRPAYNRGNRGPAVQRGIGGDVSPYDTLQYMGSPDRFVKPQTYRAPRPWDEDSDSDGSEAPAAHGLTVWGL